MGFLLPLPTKNRRNLQPMNRFVTVCLCICMSVSKKFLGDLVHRRTLQLDCLCTIKTDNSSIMARAYSTLVVLV